MSEQDALVHERAGEKKYPGVPKLDLSDALDGPLAFLCTLTRALTRLPVWGKLSGLKEKAAQQTWVEKTFAQKDLMLAILGFLLVLHGIHFTKLLICCQLISVLFYERVHDSACKLYKDVTVAVEKLKADGVAEEQNGEPNEENKEQTNNKGKNKKDRKTSSKEQADKAKSSTRAEDVELAKKVLKLLSPEKCSSAAFEVFATLIGCHMVIAGGLAQSIAVGHALVGLFCEKLQMLIELHHNEELRGWVDLAIRSAFYLTFVGLTFFMPGLVLSVNAASLGAKLATEYGLRFGFGEDAQAYLTSSIGFGAFAGLTVFGSIWQVWALLSGSELFWLLKIVYLPATLSEQILCLL